MLYPIGLRGSFKIAGKSVGVCWRWAAARWWMSSLLLFFFIINCFSVKSKPVAISLVIRTPKSGLVADKEAV